MKKLLAFAVIGIALAGCTLGSVGNPINNNTEATAESAFIVAAGVETAYLALKFCPAGTHFALTAPCKETAIIHASKADENVAYTALKQLRAFQAANPGNTVGITNLVTAVINAAQALRDALPLKGA